jgi:hypothetical protein
VWEEFIGETKRLVELRPSNVNHIKRICESINVLDSMLSADRPDHISREDCLHIAANAYKLYQLYKGGEGCDANTVTAEPSTS